jgi:hypothetical protein
VRLHPILMSILLYHHKQLTKCTSEVEQIEARVNKDKRSTKKEEEKEDFMALVRPDTKPMLLFYSTLTRKMVIRLLRE